jgi:hypothetical protein
MRRFDFGECTHSTQRLALLRHANEQNHVGIDVVRPMESLALSESPALSPAERVDDILGGIQF